MKKVELEKKINDEEITYLGDDITQQYLNEIGAYPLLSKDEEFSLACEASNGNDEARKKLIKSNLRYVVNIAKGYIGCGLSFLDLIQEGNIGLIKAIDKFDVTKGCRITTYSRSWIRAYIRNGIIEKGRTIRIPPHVMPKVQVYQNAAMVLETTLGREATENELADYLDISVQTVKKLRSFAVNLDLLSLECSISTLDDIELKDTLAVTDSHFVEDEVYGNILIAQVHDIGEKVLTSREKEVLFQRLNYDKTLEAIGVELGGITRERVRQIETKALKKLRTATKLLTKNN